MNNEELFNLVIELKSEILSLKDEIKQLRQDLLNDAPSLNVQMRDDVLHSIVRQNKTVTHVAEPTVTAPVVETPVTTPVTTLVTTPIVEPTVTTPVTEQVEDERPKIKNIFDI